MAQPPSLIMTRPSPSLAIPDPIRDHSGDFSPGAHTARTQPPSLGAPEATLTPWCVYVCVYVCVCVTYILSSLYATTSPLPTSSVFPFPSPFCPPSYTPTQKSPLIYADTLFCPLPLSYRRPILSDQFCLPRSSHARARAVASPLHPSAPVAAKYAPLCREGRGGAGCWISLSLVTSSPAQSHTFPSIPASACS